jgi:hypothetical protein
MVIRNQNNQYNYGLTFLLMKQLYDCRYDPSKDFQHCPSDEICAAREAGQFVDYTIDTSYANYFDNWFNQMDLMCVPRSKYMALGSAFFMCAGFSGILLGGFAERLGRKKTVFTLQAFSSVAQLIILFCSDYWVRLACFFVIGTCQLKNG